MKHIFTRLGLVSALGICGLACHRTTAQGQTIRATTGIAAPTSAPQTPMTAFDGSAKGFKVGYPSDWTTKPSKDDFLLLVPANDSSKNAPNITIDVPDLPPHFPGMITLKAVEHGYLDDLKKQHPALKIDEDCEQPITNGKARLVRTSWKDADRSSTETTLLIIHSDRVYLITADADAEKYVSTRAVFDGIVGSLQWVK